MDQIDSTQMSTSAYSSHLPPIPEGGIPLGFICISKKIFLRCTFETLRTWWLWVRGIPIPRHRRGIPSSGVGSSGNFKLLISTWSVFGPWEVDMSGFPITYKFIKEINLLTTWTVFKISLGKVKTFLWSKGARRAFSFCLGDNIHKFSKIRNNFKFLFETKGNSKMPC